MIPLVPAITVCMYLLVLMNDRLLLQYVRYLLVLMNDRLLLQFFFKRKAFRERIIVQKSNKLFLIVCVVIVCCCATGDF